MSAAAQHLITLPLSLAPQEIQHLQRMIPGKLLPQHGEIDLLTCYSDPTFPAAALRVMECILEQRVGVEQALHQLEETLSYHRCWSALRDVYLRHLQRHTRHTNQRVALQQKCLLLALQVAPHPTHAWHLLVDAFLPQSSPKTLIFSKEELEWITANFIQKGWLHLLSRWLDVAASSPFGSELPASLTGVLQQKIGGKQAFKGAQTLPPEEPDALRTHTSELLEQAQEEQDPDEARRLRLQAALLLSSMFELQSEAAACWHQMLSDPLPDSVCWHRLYELTIPSQRWELLGEVLQSFPAQDIQLPVATYLRLPFLIALEQGQIPHIDPIPILLRAFQLHPSDDKRFQALCRLLIGEQRWALLRRVRNLYLAHHLTTSNLSAHSSISRQTHHHFLDVLEALRSLPPTPEVQKEQFAVFLQAVTFFPHETSLISAMTLWSRSQPKEHPVHKLLKQLAKHKQGNVAFRSRMAQRTLQQYTAEQPFPSDAEEMYDAILEQHPKHKETIRAARQLAIISGQHNRVLALFDQELKLQTETDLQVALMLERADYQFWHMERPRAALQDCQKLLKLTPHDAQALHLMVECLELLEQPAKLASVLSQQLTHTKSTMLRRQLLRKLIRCALRSLQDHHIVLNALNELLQLPHSLPECIDTMEELLGIPKARIPLLSFLLEQEEALDEPHRSHTKLLIIRLMFQLLRFQEAKGRLQRFLQSSASSLPLLQEGEKIAVQHHAWKELAQSLTLQIELLQSRPHGLLSLASLYVQLGDLNTQLLGQPDEGCLAYAKALLYDPHNDKAHERLRDIFENKEAHVEIRDLLLSRSAYLRPAQAAGMIARASLIERHKRHQPEQARALLEQAQAMNPHHPMVQALL